MKTEAAILWETGGRWSVEEIELDPPKAGEVLVEMVASGLCHSDDHARTGDLPAVTPLIGGHEGSGIVMEVGEGVTHVHQIADVFTTLSRANFRVDSLLEPRPEPDARSVHRSPLGDWVPGTLVVRARKLGS